MELAQMHKALKRLEQLVQKLQSEKLELLRGHNALLQKQVQERNAQLDATSQKLLEQSRQAQLINQIVRAIRSSLVLDDVLQMTVDRLHEALQVKRCLIFRPDPERQMATRYVSEATAGREGLVGVYCNLYRHYHSSLTQGEPVVLSQIDVSLAPEIRASAQECSTYSILIVPLLQGNSYIGGISLHQRASEREWTADEIAFVQAIADHCAIAIQQSELYQQAQNEIAKRQQREAALLQSEERFCKAFHASPVAISITTPGEECFLDVNDSFLKLLGYQRQEVIGFCAAQLGMWASSDRRDKMSQLLQAQQRVRNLESQFRTKTGELREVLLSVEIVHLVGEPCLLTTIADITERKQVEAELRQAKDRLQAVLDAVPGFVSWVDAGGRYRGVNRHLAQSFNLSPEAFVGQELGFMNSSPQYAQFMNWFLASPNLRDSQVIDARINGSNRKYLIAAQKYQQGQAAVSVGIDITERQQAQAALQQANEQLEIRVEQRTAALKELNQHLHAEISERKRAEEGLQQATDQLRAVLDAVPGFVSWVGADLRYQGVNKQLAATFNLSPDAFVGQELGFMENSLGFCKFIHKFLAGSDSAASQAIDVRVNNSTRNYLIAVQKYQQGQAAVSVGIDITERKQAEEQLKASLKEKEVLLKEIHHRVKNNLQVISSLLKLQSGYIKDEEALSLFIDSYNRVRSMALIHEKLYQSQDLAKIDAADYIPILTSNLFRSYSVCSNSVSLQVHVDNIWLDIDTAIPCGLIINELVSNSLKYAFVGRENGKVSVKLFLTEQQQICFIVSDNGVGLPPDFNIEETESLGLQLVSNLSEQLGGDIQIDSRGGTHFKIAFVNKNSRD